MWEGSFLHAQGSRPFHGAVPVPRGTCTSNTLKGLATWKASSVRRDAKRSCIPARFVANRSSIYMPLADTREVRLTSWHFWSSLICPRSSPQRAVFLSLVCRDLVSPVCSGPNVRQEADWCLPDKCEVNMKLHIRKDHGAAHPIRFRQLLRW
jgi:hypothetical protein